MSCGPITPRTEREEGAMFVWEVRDQNHRLVAYCFEKRLAMEWARIFEGTWKALEHAPIDGLLLR